MKKKQINNFDILVEKLAEGFSKVKDFDKLQESEEGKRLFDLIVKSTSEIETFESLFLNYYIPASNKSIVDTWNQVSKSKYKHLLNLRKDDLKENLYETIRLGYVGLFHKYESYLKSLVDAINFLLSELNEENKLLNIQDYCKKEYNVDIFKSHNRFSITNRINYISLCVKHYDGFPIKEPINPEFKYHNPNEKIRIEKDKFKIDIERLKIHCNSMLSQIIMMGFKQYFDSEDGIIKQSLREELKDNPETFIKVNEVRDNFNKLLSDFKD